MLDQLNFDIWTVILPSLECQDIAALGAVNRALRVLSWEDRSWKHQWEKAHCTHTTDDAPRPLRLRVQQAITSARGWNSASCTQQWLAPCTNPAPPPYPAEQVTAASFGSQTGSTVTRKFTALCLRGNLLVTASMPTRRDGASTFVSVYHLPSSLCLIDAQGPPSRYGVSALDMRGPLDMRGGLLVAAEPRGDCNMWRLAKGFWDVVGELEGRQSTPLVKHTLIQRASDSVCLLSTIRDATAAFTLRFPWACQVHSVHVLGAPPAPTHSPTPLSTKPHHPPQPQSAQSPAQPQPQSPAPAAQPQSTQSLPQPQPQPPAAAQPPAQSPPPPATAAAAVLIECPMYERRLVALTQEGLPVGNYAYPDGASFDALTGVLAVPGAPTLCTDPESSFTTGLIHLHNIITGTHVCSITPKVPSTMFEGPRSLRVHPRTATALLDEGKYLAVLRSVAVDETCGDALLYWLNVWQLHPTDAPDSNKRRGCHSSNVLDSNRGGGCSSNVPDSQRSSSSSSTHYNNNRRRSSSIGGAGCTYYNNNNGTSYHNNININDNHNSGNTPPDSPHQCSSSSSFSSSPSSFCTSPSSSPSSNTTHTTPTHHTSPTNNSCTTSPSYSMSPHHSMSPMCLMAVEFSGYCGNVPRIVVSNGGPQGPTYAWLWKWRFWFVDTMHMEGLQLHAGRGDDDNGGGTARGGGGNGSGSGLFGGEDTGAGGSGLSTAADAAARNTVAPPPDTPAAPDHANGDQHANNSNAMQATQHPPPPHTNPPILPQPPPPPNPMQQHTSRSGCCGGGVASIVTVSSCRTTVVRDAAGHNSTAGGGGSDDGGGVSSSSDEVHEEEGEDAHDAVGQLRLDDMMPLRMDEHMYDEPYSNWFCRGPHVLDRTARQDGSGGARVLLVGRDRRVGVWQVPENVLSVLPVDEVPRGTLQGHPAYGNSLSSSLKHACNGRWLVLMAEGKLQALDFCASIKPAFL